MSDMTTTPDTGTPPASGADRITIFGDDAANPAHVLYDLDVDIRHVGRRVVRLGFVKPEHWRPAAHQLGRDIRAELGLTEVQTSSDPLTTRYEFNVPKALGLYRSELQAEGAPQATIDEVDAAIVRFGTSGTDPHTSGYAAITQLRLAPLSGWSAELMGGTDQPSTAAAPAAGQPALRAGASGGRVGLSLGTEPNPYWPDPVGMSLAPDAGPVQAQGLLARHIDVFLAALSRGELLLPRRKWSGELTLVGASLPKVAEAPGESDGVDPTLFLVEQYELVASTHGFGLGRTLRVATFLPGVSLTIPVISWRPIQGGPATSVLDSFTTAAANDLVARLGQRFGDADTRGLTQRFACEIYSSAGFSPFVSDARSPADLASPYGRTEWARSVEHALVEQCGRSSDLRITAQDVVRGVEPPQTSFQTASNVNLRAAMSAVYRQLNRRFHYELRPTDVRIGFCNGRLHSWSEAPIWELHDFLSTLLTDEAAQNVEAGLLALLEEILKAEGGGATPDDAEAESPGGSGPTLAGVEALPKGLPQIDIEQLSETVLAAGEVGLATGSALGEVLMGQADALDAYALALQASDTDARQLQNELQTVMREALEAIADPAARTAAFAEAYRPDSATNLRIEQTP